MTGWVSFAEGNSHGCQLRVPGIWQLACGKGYGGGKRASARRAGIPWLAAHAGCYLVAPFLAAVPFTAPSSGLVASSQLSANFRWDLVAPSRPSANFRWEMNICSAKS